MMTNATDPGARAPGMADVARLAQVSTQTVSRTLRGEGYIKEDTRQRVLAAVEQLGYRMNTAARALSSGRTRTIGVVTMATGSYAGAMTQMSIQRRAEELGYNAVGAQSATLDADTIVSSLRRVERQGAEGLILALPLRSPDSRIDAITARVPTVTIGGSPSASAQSLAVDQQLVARLATEHLLSLGHETVWLVAGPDDWVDSTNRSTGWRKSLAAADRAAPEPIRGDWSPESGYQAGLVLAARPDVTAVFVANDDMAFGVVRAFHERGRRVPDDISIVGVDDIMLAAYCSPALTTVAQPFAELCAAAVGRIVAQLENHSVSGESLDVTPRLIVRASTAAPRATSR